MKFDFEKNLQERLAKPEYNTEINLDEIVKKIKYPAKAPSLEDLKKYVHAFDKEMLPMDTVLTKSQMLEDFEQYKFLIKYIYSGYKVLGEEFFENAFKKISAFIKANPNCHQTRLCRSIKLIT